MSRHLLLQVHLVYLSLVMSAKQFSGDVNIVIFTVLFAGIDMPSPSSCSNRVSGSEFAN